MADDARSDSSNPGIPPFPMAVSPEAGARPAADEAVRVPEGIPDPHSTVESATSVSPPRSGFLNVPVEAPPHAHYPSLDDGSHVRAPSPFDQPGTERSELGLPSRPAEADGPRPLAPYSGVPRPDPARRPVTPPPLAAESPFEVPAARLTGSAQPASVSLEEQPGLARGDIQRPRVGDAAGPAPAELATTATSQESPASAPSVGPELESPAAGILAGAPRTTPPPLPSEHQDRQGRLAGLGMLWIAAGFVVAAPAPVALAQRGEAVASDWRVSVPLVVGHVVPSVLLIVIGLGSVFAQRWARHLVLATATLAFAISTAVLAGGLIFAISSGRLSRNMGEFVRTGMMCLAGLALLWMVISAYSHPSVRATCEARHTKPSWTDRRQGGVLVLIVLCFVLAAQCVLRSADTAFPAAGRLLDGPPGEWAWWAAAGWFFVAAVLNIIPSLAGWWMAFIGITALVASFVWTVLGPVEKIAGWWRVDGLTAADAGLLASGLFLLALMLLGSVLPHYQKSRAA